MEFKDIVRKRRLEIGATLEEIGKAVGVSKATVQRWESGEIKNVRRDKINRLADALQTTPSCLMGWEEPSSMPLPANMRPFDSKIDMVPVVSPGRGGWNGLPLPVYDGAMPVYDRRNPQEYVWMQAEGDSMSPDINDGDFVLVHLQPVAENGDYVIALLSGEEGTLKIFSRDSSGIMLRPLNPQHPYRFIPKDRSAELRIYGVVVESKRKFK